MAEHALVGEPRGVIPLCDRPELATPALAARINGTAAHSFELDDLYEPASLHPGAAVISAALAAALTTNASGRELLAAIATGYETIGRIGVATASQVTPFHTTGTHGSLGACAAAARLAGFGPEPLVNSFGIAASFPVALRHFRPVVEKSSESTPGVRRRRA